MSVFRGMPFCVCVDCVHWSAFVDEPSPPFLSQVKGERFSQPFVSVERSRSQVLCRTGLRGAGQSWVLKYGRGKEYRDEAAAVKAARAWLAGVKK